MDVFRYRQPLKIFQFNQKKGVPEKLYFHLLEKLRNWGTKCGKKGETEDVKREEKRMWTQMFFDQFV